MSRSLLITGATGKQGGAVISALLAAKPPVTNIATSVSNDEFTILAVTRNPNSASARRLAALSPSIKLIKASPDGAVWGVFSVQAVDPPKDLLPGGQGDVTAAPEVKQGVALIDEAIKRGVEHFVYSSVDRGGEDKSWDNPTPIPHFRTKHHIEHHLRDVTTSAAPGSRIGWTILRPVIFMDNLTPGFFGKVFLTSLRDTLPATKRMPWIATSDIGWFAAQSFRDPGKWNHRAVSLAGDELTFQELDDKFRAVTGKPAPVTFSFLGSALKWGVKEVAVMLNWFRDEGYQVDVKGLRKVHKDMLDFETWLREKSAFVKCP